MQRRTFLNTSIWGVLGCTVLPGAVYARPVASINSKIQELIDLLGFRGQNIFSIEDSLYQCGEEYLTNWLKNGYVPFNTRLFWKAGSDYAIIPVQLRHAQLGVLDTGTLHFTQSAHGQWEYSGSLSGYHMEAIRKACIELDLKETNAAYLRQLLLPIPASSDALKLMDTFPTQLGSFELQAKIHSDHTQVFGRLKEADKIIWESEYLSDHMRQGVTQGLLA